VFTVTSSISIIAGAEIGNVPGVIVGFAIGVAAGVHIGKATADWLRDKLRNFLPKLDLEHTLS